MLTAYKSVRSLVQGCKKSCFAYWRDSLLFLFAANLVVLSGHTARTASHVVHLIGLMP